MKKFIEFKFSCINLYPILLSILFFGFSNYANSQTTYYARANGTWNSNTTWSLTNGGAAVGTGIFPGADDSVIIIARNVFIPANTVVACATITISGVGVLTFVTATPNSNSLTCTGIFYCGTTTKGTLAMVNGSKLTCEKLVLGAASSAISGRNGVISSSFVFTGTGTGIIPVLTGDSSTLADFNDVTFNPSTAEIVKIPLGLSVKTMSILNGTVDFETNYNNTFTSGTSLSMSADTTLLIGGTNQLPYNAYVLNPTSTINYTGAIQIIRELPFPNAYQNLTLSGPGVKTLGGDVNINLTLTIQTGVTLNIGTAELSINGTYLNTGTGCIRGSRTSSLWYKGYADSSFSFDQVFPNGNDLKNISVGLSQAEGGLLPEPGNNLDLIVENTLNIYGNVTLASGHLVTNNNVTLKSDENTTAMIAAIENPNVTGITGDITIERYIPNRRAYRPLTSSVNGTYIFNNWQESGSTASLTGTILGNTLTTVNPSTPLVVGQRISGNLIPANTTITDITNAASNEYQISTIQNVATRLMTASSGIASSTIVARFTGEIAGNILTTSLFTLGTGLTVGQKIAGGTLTNTVVTALLGNGAYTIGLKIPSTIMYYNGAPAGFGTHITGLVCTDAQLSQNDNATGLDLTRSGNSSLYTYNNSTNAFTPVTNTKTQAVTAGKPYFILIRGDRTIDLGSNASLPTNTTLRNTGTIVTGPVDVSPSLNTTAASFNFIGNPYQSPVDLSLMFFEGSRWYDLGESYTVFDTTLNTRGAYVAYDFNLGTNSNASSLADATIEPNQAFFVNTTGPTPALIFNETDKNTTQNDYVTMFRSAFNATPKIKGTIVNESTNKALDGFILAFSDTYSNTIQAEDTRKPTGNLDETVSSKNDINKMAIDKRNFPLEEEEIGLNITQYRLTNYILKFDISNFNQMEAYLIDAYLVTETSLINNEINLYPFTVDTTIPASVAENRFKIVFRNSALNTNSININQFAVYPNPVEDNGFTIKLNPVFSGKDASITIHNSLGQKVYSFNGVLTTDSSITVTPNVSLSKGIYVLNIAVDGKNKTKKLIIK